MSSRLSLEDILTNNVSLLTINQCFDSMLLWHLFDVFSTVKYQCHRWWWMMYISVLENFYNGLNNVANELKNSSLLFLTGYWNVKVGRMIKQHTSDILVLFEITVSFSVKHLCWSPSKCTCRSFYLRKAV